MGNEVIHSIAAIFAGITGVAILAVLVSKNSQTSQVINAAGSAYQGSLAVALSPITGTNFTGNAMTGNPNSLGAGTQY